MDSIPAALHAGASGARVPPPAPLLVGRTLEQLFLREELAAVLGGRGRLVLLGGEAGIGKTALARDLASEAAARGAQVLVGACYDLTNTPPYGPWLDLFDAGGLDRDLHPPPPAAFKDGRLERVTDQAALFAEVRGYFAQLSATRPALLLLEDLHWADPASLELLRHLAPRLRHVPILLLITYRGDELTRRHPFAVQLPALVREADGLRIDLRRLDEAALHALVATRCRLSRFDESRLVAYLDRHAEGNPLFATELLRALQEEGLLRPADNGWTLDKLNRVVVPSFLRQVIESRVARLGEAMRRPLSIASVIGQEVPLALWAEVAGVDDEEALLTIVERAVDAHLLEADPDGGRVRFVHALTRETLYVSVLPPRRRQWHRGVGESLAAGPRPDPDAVAYHFQAAGDPRAWEWLIKAGDRAQRAYAWLTAAERLRAAAALLEEVEGLERTRGRLACRVAYLTRFSDPAGAIEAVDVAARVAARTGDTVMAAETQWLRGLLLCYLNHFRFGLAEMTAGFDALEAMPAERARVPAALRAWFADALPAASPEDGGNEEPIAARPDDDPTAWRGVSLGRFLASAGHLRAAVDDCERAVNALGGVSEVSEGNRAAIAFSCHGLGVAQAGLGRPEEARAAFAAARADFGELGHHAMVAFTLLNELVDVALAYDAANPAARRRLAAETEAALDRTGGALRPGVSPRLVWLGCFVLDGEWQEADRILRDLSDPGNAYLRREITAARVVLARHRGNPECAWEEIRGLLPDGSETEPGDLIHQEGLFLQRIAADLCLDKGDVRAAHTWLAAHDRWLAWSESVLGRAAGHVGWARYHLAAGDNARARAAVADALALATTPDQPLVRLAAHRLLGEVETASRNRAVAEAHLATALDLAATCEAPFERALTLLALAHQRFATGQTEEVAELVDEVRAICAPLGAIPTLASADALAARLTPTPPAERNPAGLTSREVEILRLLPRGLSNPEIAATLFISPRTVQTHLTNLYAKLGVDGRAEAIVYSIGHGVV